MSIAVPDRPRSLSPLSRETQPASVSLVVHLHRDAESCVASFSGSLAGATRVTIDGIAELISGERSVLLDFSRAEVVDQGGADALEALVVSLRVQGTDLQVAEPVRRRGNARALNGSTLGGSFPGWD
jgi:hypothetical protein